MLEIVITGRHDDYGGADFFDRLCAAADHNHRLLQQAGVDHRFTLVEWNPIEGRPLLAERIRAALPWWHNSLIVDPLWHARLSTNPKLRFMEFFAKNAAVRRSTADAILTTNTDVFLSTEVARALATMSLDDRTVYRAERVDIDRHVPWHTGGECVFADPACQLRVNDVQPPYYGNSAGDFLLLTRRAWMSLGGFNERVRFAKIHKDGQFCVNAHMKGYAFDVLGPIYHIDHDGSYANAGAMRGSPDAPYGPEWDYWQPYRNPASWGLTSAIDQPADNGISWICHPATHGPTLSIVECRQEEDAAAEAEVVHRGDRCEWLQVTAVPETLARAVNAAIAETRGQFVLVTEDVTLADFGGCDALVTALETTSTGLTVAAGALLAHPRLGPVPAANAPYVIRRDVIDALTEWDETAADPALAFWLAAIERTEVSATAASESPKRHRAPRTTHVVEAAVLTRRKQLLPDVVVDGALQETLIAARSARSLVDQWITQTLPDASTRCAIVGPDWATGMLVEALRDRGRIIAGVFTSMDDEVDTCRWGERLRPLAALAQAGAAAIVTGTPGDLARRLGALGVRIPLHAPTHADGPACAADSDLDALRRAQAHALRTNNLDDVLGRLPLLCEFEGTRRWAHRYDAAQLCERHGRPDEARRLYRDVMLGSQNDTALRMRATFHTARLLVAQGHDIEALPLLHAVLAHNPVHGAARTLLQQIVIDPTEIAGVAV